MALTEDEPDDDVVSVGVEGDEGDEGDDQPKRRNSTSGKSTTRSKGSARVAAYTMPIPLAYQPVDGGYQ
eukprot:4692668-Prymnesium_polylepis.1